MEEGHIKLVISRGGKQTPLELSLASSATVQELKEAVQTATGISPTLMKLLFKGSQLKEPSKSLSEVKLKSGSKIILMASQTEDIAKVAAGAIVSSLMPSQGETAVAQREPLSELTEHKKIISKGPLPDTEPGLVGARHSLPERGIFGLYNGYGQKTRLSFKYQEMVIGTNERTLPVTYDSIQNVASEPIQGQEQYHILALQLGPTEKSNYYLYFVPCQYVEAIKDIILGRFPF